MFDRDISIGKGDRLNSATKVFGIPGDKADVSENRVSYWTESLMFGNRIYIMKDSPEGVALKTAIDNKASSDVINNFLDDLVIKNLTPNQLKKHIRRLMSESYKNGERHRSAAIRKLLGVQSAYDSI